MPIIDTTPQTNALSEELLLERQVPATALRAIEGARELEAEVMLLRTMLAAKGPNSHDGAWQEEVARLLGKVILFRVALAGELKK